MQHQDYIIFSLLLLLQNSRLDRNSLFLEQMNFIVALFRVNTESRNQKIIALT